MPEYRLGWLPDVPDRRDVRFSKVFRAPRKLPYGVDLRGACSPIKHQGELGSCTAHALTGALEFLQLEALGAGMPERYRDLSRLFVYFNTREIMGTIHEDSGAMLRTGIKTLKAAGVCREELWPYVISRFAKRPPRKCYIEALNHRVEAYQRLDTLDDMKTCLAIGLPFVFGFAVYEHVMSKTVEKTGRIRLPGRGERMLGGHAVMAVGYRDRTRTLIFRNSWGREWGRNGYGEIPYAYPESRELSDDFWCIQSTENDLYAAWRRAGPAIG